MNAAALIQFLPLLLEGATEVANLIQRLQAEGRAATTAQEQANLQTVLTKLGMDEALFEQQFGIKPTA
jgi:hypothetical protein